MTQTLDSKASWRTCNASLVAYETAWLVDSSSFLGRLIVMAMGELYSLATSMALLQVSGLERRSSRVNVVNVEERA